MPQEGERAPDFSLPGVTPDGDQVDVTLSELKGSPVVLYFYPKDDTRGCTTQACSIRDEWSAFEDAGAVVLGVSPDDIASHRDFSEKYSLPFTLLADADHEVAEKYGVWTERTIFGRKVWGNQRSTFIIGAEGRIERVFPRVRPEEHTEQVLEVLAG